MGAIARDLDFCSRVFAALAAVFLVRGYGASACRMRAFDQVDLGHGGKAFLVIGDCSSGGQAASDGSISSWGAFSSRSAASWHVMHSDSQGSAARRFGLMLS